MKEKKEKEQGICVDGVVEEVNGFFFKVRLNNNMVVQAYISGKMRRQKKMIKVLLGDTVQVRLSEYDLDKGAIIYRYDKANKAIKRK